MWLLDLLSCIDNRLGHVNCDDRRKFLACLEDIVKEMTSCSISTPEV